MKTRTPWRPLLRNELLLDHFPIIPWIAGGGYCLVTWFLAGWAPLAMMTNLCHGDIAVFFSSFGDFIFPFACLWLFVLLMWIGAKTVPCIMAMPSNEFYFTRAIARRSLFRARMIVLCAVALGPLILNMFIALGTPDLIVKPGTIRTLTALGMDENPGTVEGMVSIRKDAERRADYYLQAFPGEHPKLSQHDVKTPLEIVLPGATLVFAAWLLWSATLGLLAMQSYGSLMAKHVSRRWGAVLVFAGLPILPVVFLLVCFHGLTTAMPEAGFLFFARHELVLVLAVVAAIPIVQWWAERRFEELEIT